MRQTTLWVAYILLPRSRQKSGLEFGQRRAPWAGTERVWICVVYKTQWSETAALFREEALQVPARLACRATGRTALHMHTLCDSLVVSLSPGLAARVCAWAFKGASPAGCPPARFYRLNNVQRGISCEQTSQPRRRAPRRGSAHACRSSGGPLGHLPPAEPTIDGALVNYSACVAVCWTADAAACCRAEHLLFCNVACR